MLSLGRFWGLCKFWGLVDEMLQRCKASDGMGKLGEGSILWGGKIRGDGNAGLCLVWVFSSSGVRVFAVVVECRVSGHFEG